MKILREDFPNAPRVVKKNIDSIVIHLSNGTEFRIEEAELGSTAGPGLTVNKINAPRTDPARNTVVVRPQYANVIHIS